MKQHRVQTVRFIAITLGAFALSVYPIGAADVITDGNMEQAGIANWPHTDITASNGSAKATDQSASGQSLKGTSAAGRRINVGWYNAQAIGTVNGTDTVSLSLWWGAQWTLSNGGGANGTLFVDINDGGGWTNIWNQVLTPDLAFTSGTVTAQNVSASFAGGSYDFRLRFEGQTGNNNSAEVLIWWDDVILDVVPAGGGDTTTLGDGTDPTAAPTICPNPLTPAMLDAFSFVTSGNSDVVDDVTVGFGAGDAQYLSKVEVTNAAGSIVYGEANNPTDTQVVTLSLNTLTANGSVTDYRLRITPKDHASQPATGTFAITGIVTDFTPATNSKAGSDVDSDTVTIDNAAPAGVNFTGCNGVSASQIDLTWQDPTPDNVLVVRGPAGGTCPVFSPTDGTVYSIGPQGPDTLIYTGSGTGASDSGLGSSTTYCYEVWEYDSCANYVASPGVTSCATQGTPGAALTPDNANTTAVASSCNQITVTVKFTGDLNGNSSTLVRYYQQPSGPWLTGCATLLGPSPRQCIISGLNPSTTYDIEVDHTDPDGVDPTDPQTIAGVATPACGGDQVAPTVLILAPARLGIIGGTDRVKVQVWDADTSLSALEWRVDGGSWTSFLGGQNGNYNCGTGCGIYEFDLDTVTLFGVDHTGSHTLEIRATDSASPSNNVALRSTTFNVNNAGGAAAGSGHLLRRTPGSQLCIDCHNLQTHSSQNTTTNYGNWALDCLTCHTPHETTNIYLIREQIETPSSGTKSVVFQVDDKAGGTNPNNSYLGDTSGPSNTPYDDGVCEVCHTQTTHWRNDTSGGDHSHSQNARCVTCHEHEGGFKGKACNACHSAPSTAGAHQTHYGIATVPTVYEETTVQTTAADYGFPCAKCHTGTGHPNDTHAGTLGDPFQVEIVFDTTTTPANPGGTYNQIYPDATQVGPDGRYWSWTSSLAGTDGQCGNLYCHSNASPLGGSNVFATPQWNESSTGCNFCHDVGGSPTGLSAAHAIHTNDTGYAFECANCHDATTDLASDTVVSDKRFHVDADKTLDFDPGIDSNAGTYDSGAHTCDDIYCHSNGVSLTGPWTTNPTPAWTGSTDCGSCHGGAVGDSTVQATGKHTNHINNSALMGVNYDCEDCHSATASGSGTIVGFANHVSQSVEVSLLGGGSYTAPNCTNTACHNSGQDSGGGTSYEAYSVNWNTDTLDCQGCHGRHTENAFTSVAGEPNYANDTGAGGADANSHDVHVQAATDCADCHTDTTTTGTSIKAGSILHLDGTRQVRIDATWDSDADPANNYNGGTKTCTNVDCHPAGVAQSPVWGGPSAGDPNGFGCRDCHGATGAGNQDANHYTAFKDGNRSIQDLDDWAVSGHGATANYEESNNGPGRFDDQHDPTLGQDGCAFCHDPGVEHGTASNPFRLRNVGAASTILEKNGVCLVCHEDTSDAGVDLGWDAINSDLSVGDAPGGGALGNHYGYNHNSPGKEGGMFCWDCHDPHGDYNYTGTQDLSFMMQEVPVADHDGTSWGESPTLFGKYVDFHDDLDGDVNGGTWTWNDYVIDTEYGDGFYHGICQACHTQNARFLNDEGLNGYAFANDDGPNHFEPQRCTQAGCHLHNNTFTQKGCNECHDAPPVPTSPVDVHTAHYEDSAIIPQAYTNLTPATTATTYYIPCAKCHSPNSNNPAATTHFNDLGNHSGSAGDGFSVEVSFDDTTLPNNAGGSYDQEAYAGRAEDQGAPADGRYWRYTDEVSPGQGSCSNLYCHSNAAPVGGLDDKKQVWWVGDSLTCSGCHATTGATTGGSTDLSENHAKHINGGANHSYTCDECHALTVQDDSTSVISDKREHVDGGKDVGFSAVAFPGDNVDQSGGNYTGGTCSGTYCHSQGQSTTSPFGGGPNLNPDWNTGSANCETCHSGNAAATNTMASNAHGAHVDQSAYLGSNFNCARCHADTVVAGNDTAINDVSFHVNTTRDVNMSDGGTWTAPSCTNSYCHSSGQATGAPIEYENPPNWNSGTPLANNCAVCHGSHSDNAFAPVAGEPNYTNQGAGAARANSHAAHVSVAADCGSCHYDTSRTGTSIVSGSTIHIDGSRDIVIDPAYDTNGATSNYDSGTKTCNNVSCHGTDTPQWGGTASCLGCHGTTGVETDDLGASFWNNATTATINTTEWSYSGHGKTSGQYDVTNNPAANFPTTPTAGVSECLYCHDDGVGHGISTNPFRLRNTGGADGQNGNCLACHKAGSAGVTPSGQSNVNGSTKADTAHYGTKHNATTMGGTFCWDCHDPHGERPSNTDSSGNNILMIQRQVQAVQDGTYGYLGGSGVARNVEFYNKTPAGNQPSPVGRVVETATSLGTDHLGICQACHGDTNETDWTKYWERTGYDDPDGPPSGNRYSSGNVGSPPHHNTAQYCQACHDHDNEFAGAGGDCIACHGGAGAAGTQGPNSRRPTDADFDDAQTESHHVGSGGTYMGGALTNYDCVVCHAEGYIGGTGDPVTSATYHGGDGGSTSIDLKNVDTLALTDAPPATPGTDVFQFDKEAAGMPAKASPGNWNSGNAEWRNQTSTALDPFCLTCHDSDGATMANVGSYDDPHNATFPAGASNPFGDKAITNEYDQVIRDRNNDPPVSPGQVVDIKSMVTAGGSDLDTDPGRAAQGINDPPEGIYSRHAIRGQSQSVYVGTHGVWDTSTYWNTDARFNGFTWASNSVMSCADCHTTDGAPGTAGNAHGSDSEYLLKDMDGGASEGTYSGGSGNYVCWACHAQSFYQGGTGHTGNGGDFQDYTGSTGSARIPAGNTGGNVFGIACMNCHGGYGGADFNSNIAGMGTIHGTSQILGTGSDGTGDCGKDPCDPHPREAYRFTNGASMRYYNPMGWTGSSSQCFTISGQDAPWGGCTKHGGGQSRTKGAPAQRPISY